jgi:single-strand DNA-binding protein
MSNNGRRTRSFTIKIKKIMLNSVTLIGHLGKDSTTKIIGDTTVSTFSIATNRSFKKNNEWVQATDWNKVEYWGLSEKVQALLSKGARVVVQGSLRTNSWEEEGKKRFATIVRGNFIRVLDKVTEQPIAETQVTPTQAEEVFKPASEDDLPF